MTTDRRRMLTAEAGPRAANSHRGLISFTRTGSAATLTTVYIVLLFAFPSNLRFSALGSLGKPALIWGVVLLLIWFLGRLQRRDFDVRPIAQPVRWAFGAFVVVALVGFAAAMLRGQPADQVTPAISSLVRIASWAGVLLIVMDGVRTRNDLATLARRLVIGATIVAAMGIAQFLSGSSLLDWISALPGVSAETGGVSDRGGFIRAVGTATHPLEFTAMIAGLLPVAISTAIAKGFRDRHSRRSLKWWIPVIVILLACMLGVSRSAIIGLAVAVVATLPSLPRTYRWIVAFGALIGGLAVAVIVPGILATTLSLFTQASDDPSTQSRTNALARVSEFVQSSPIYGQGFGTFLPRYYIFDNAWVLVLVEMGVVGLVAFMALVGTGLWSALTAARDARFDDTKLLAKSVGSSLLTMAVLYLFFDGLSFAISAGLLFLLIGMAAALRTVSSLDVTLALASDRLRDFPTETQPVSIVSRPSRSISASG